MYRMYDMIMKKRSGAEHTADEIRFIVEGFTKGEIPDYQMSAWLMCVYYKGMTHNETCALTHAMAQSGDQLSLAAIHGVKVDKHSTGGVGDKTTFIVAPILASLGVPVAKMSGRGLGHTGGTIDKLESIPGFCVSIPEAEFIEHVNSMKLALVGQTGDLAPADKKIYALRDVTATVDSLPLIASSIMSKKLAAGADAIVLDVKCGSGAFMKNEADANALAQIMVDIGKTAGRTCYGVITDMNEPLGCKVGNALEVIEAVQVLSMKNVKPYLTYDTHGTSGDTDVQSWCDTYSTSENIAQQGCGADRTDMADCACMENRAGYDMHGIHRLLTVSLTLAAYMYMAAGKSDDFEDAKTQCEKAIESGAALAKFKEFVEAQGGDGTYIDDVNKFRLAANCVPIICEEDGYLAACNTSEVGMVNLILGGGRATKDSTINLGVGLDIRKHLGDVVRKGDVLAYMYLNDMGAFEEAKKRLLGAYTILDENVQTEAIVKKIVM